MELALSQFELPVEVLRWFTSLPHWTWLPPRPGIDIPHHHFTKPKTFWQNVECCVRLSRTKWRAFSVGLFHISMHREKPKMVSTSSDGYSHSLCPQTSQCAVPQTVEQSQENTWRQLKLKEAPCAALNPETWSKSQTSPNHTVSAKKCSPSSHFPLSFPSPAVEPRNNSAVNESKMTREETVTLSIKLWLEIAGGAVMDKWNNTTIAHTFVYSAVLLYFFFLFFSLLSN